MSLGAKQQLVKELGEQLSDELTATQLKTVLSTLVRKLEGFEVEAIADPSSSISMDLLKDFLNAKIIEGKSPKTIERYKYILTKALTQINCPATKVTVAHLRAWLMGERTRGVADSTLEGSRSILRSYFSWLHREGIITIDPTANLTTIKCAKIVRMPYSDVEIERLKAGCKSVRDKALVCFLLSTGCRVSEVVGLNFTAVDYTDMSCKVRGKGNKERIVYIDSVTAMYLKQYMAIRKDGTDALFAARGGRRFTAAGIEKLLRELGERTGIQNVHPHRFRRTLATNLINRGMPIQEVAHILGHEKLDTTMRYVFIDDVNVKTAYQKYS